MLLQLVNIHIYIFPLFGPPVKIDKIKRIVYNKEITNELFTHVFDRYGFFSAGMFKTDPLRK